MTTSFIKVTGEASSVATIYINTSQITEVLRDNDGITKVGLTNGGWAICQETVEEVMKMIRESQLP